MKKIVVVGGGVAAKGFLGAASSFLKDAQFTMIRSNPRGPVPCGIPYAFGTLDDPNMNQSPDKPLLDAGVEMIIDDVTGIDRKSKEVSLRSGGPIKYDKLVLATGSHPIVPPFEGRDLDGIYTLKKDLDDVVRLKSEIDKAESITIVGGGFIGVELADEISKMGKNMTLVELAPNCLNVAFEPEISQKIEGLLSQKGINVLTKTAVQGFRGEGRVEKVVLSDGREIDSDMVFLAIGAQPNIEIAKLAGLATDGRSGVFVDEFQMTSDEDILAIGDCASKRDLFTKGFSNVRLASVAAKEGRNAAYSLLGMKSPLAPSGVSNLFSTAIDGNFFAAAGMTKSQCKDRELDVIEIRLSASNRHPASLPDSEKISGIFFFDRKDLRLMGAQLCGNQQVAETINAIGVAMQENATAFNLYGYNYGTHPLGTSSPNHYVMHQAARKAISSFL